MSEEVIGGHILLPAVMELGYCCTICGEFEELPAYMQHSTNIPEMCKQCRADLAEIIKERRAKKKQP